MSEGKAWSAGIACALAVWATDAVAADAPLPEDPVRVLHFDASLEAVILTREQTGDFVILGDTIAGQPILTGRDYDFDWEPGADARLGVQFGSLGVAARFFGGFQWEESASLTTPVIWNFPTNPPLFGLGVADIDTMTASFTLARSGSPFRHSDRCSSLPAPAASSSAKAWM